MSAKFSIITAVLNREATVVHALKSIKNQSYANVECVVIDGASTDRTIEKVKGILQLSDFLLSEPDGGIYDALNKGISHASGDIIGFLHSDDVYADNLVLEKIAEEFNNNDLDIVYGDVTFFNLNSPSKVLRRYRSGNFTKSRMAWGRMPAHPAMFMKKSLYEKYGNFSTEYKIAGDNDFLCRLISNGEKNLAIRYMPDVLIKMAIGGISTGGLKNTILLNKEVLKSCLDNNIQTNYFKILSKYPFKILEFVFK